jgi:hypothetical protein
MDINIIDFQTIDYDKIFFSQIVNITSNRKKIFIGYENSECLTLITPYFLNNMIFLPNNKYQYIKIIFDPLAGQIYEFYKVIQNIENIINSYIDEILPSYKFVSILKSDLNNMSDIFDEDENNNDALEGSISELNISYINLKLNLTETKDGKITKVYNNNFNECNLSELKNGWKFKCLLNFSYVWFDTDKKRCGLNLDLLQIKIHQPIYLNKCLIDSNIGHNQLSHNQYNPNIISKYSVLNNLSNISMQDIPDHHQQNINGEKIVVQNNIQNINNKPIMIIPNANELLNIKNALKKVL